jgi:hypothetical protein
MGYMGADYRRLIAIPSRKSHILVTGVYLEVRGRGANVDEFDILKSQIVSPSQFSEVPTVISAKIVPKRKNREEII